MLLIIIGCLTLAALIFVPKKIPRDLIFFIGAVTTSICGIIPAKVLFDSIANPAILTVACLGMFRKGWENKGWENVGIVAPGEVITVYRAQPFIILGSVLILCMSLGLQSMFVLPLTVLVLIGGGFLTLRQSVEAIPWDYVLLVAGGLIFYKTISIVCGVTIRA